MDVLSALNVFNGAPDKASIEKANTWLQEFQHSPEAWMTCNSLLLSPDVPPAAKLFAAQTFRAKVTYDLEQIQPNVLPLRDTLLEALNVYQNGPKTIVTQLCLAVSGLALQLPTWGNAVQTMIDKFGRNPATVPVALQFLTVLPEELNTNTKIPITDEDYRERAAHLLTDNVAQVLDLLGMYIRAEGVTITIQNLVFQCLRNWLIAGEINVNSFSETPLFGDLFDALASDDLFDSAVDAVCDLIHETQEVDDCMPAIERIVQRVIALKSEFTKHTADPERIRGYARIFAEAGETYRVLIMQHTETFFPLVEVLGQCAAYPDLDIVPITFPFWMRLAQTIGKKPSVSPLFIDAYKSLMAIIIRHLHFPAEATSISGEDMEKFRSFRHVMGDTLKDCCYVLGSEMCLHSIYDMIATELSVTQRPLAWQTIEAPLFAMRSVGAEVDVADDNSVAKFFDLIPSLPEHPRIRYATLLIISRYTEWINLRPQYIQFTLQYISSGFESTDSEVCAAAGQALKYLCQDCKQHLVDFLPTLHTFLNTTGVKLVQEDRREVYTAIAYVISAMPMEHAAHSLRTFSADILAQAHALVSLTAPPSKEDIRKVCDGLENLEQMLHVIRSFGEELPESCKSSCQEAWSIFDAFIEKYGSNYDLAERTNRVLRHGITLFDKTAQNVVSPAVKRLSVAFESTGYPSYLWIAGKLIGTFGDEEDLAIRASFKDVYERSTNRVVETLRTTAAHDVPDVLEDYIQMLLQLHDAAPDIFYQSSAFLLAFKASMEAMTLVVADVIFAALDLFRNIFSHECLSPDALRPPPPKFAIYAAAINAVLEKEGLQFVTYLLQGLVGEFPEESTSSVVTIFRNIASLWGNQLLQWLPVALDHLPTASVPGQAKSQFLTEVATFIHSAQFDKVKYCILTLHRTSRKLRERRRTTPM